MRLRYKGHHDIIGSVVLVPGHIYENVTVVKAGDSTGIRLREDQPMRRFTNRAFEMLWEIENSK